jgi:hypothetical protein
MAMAQSSEREAIMSSWMDEAIAEEHRKDLLRAADRRRITRQAQAARRGHTRLYSSALVRLGQWLEAWGCGLQARYGRLADTGVVAPAGDRATGH